MKNFFIGVPMFTKFIKERMDNKKNVVFIITRENLRKIPKGGAALRKVFGKGNINKVHPMSFVDKLRLDRKSGHAGIVYEKSQVL